MKISALNNINWKQISNNLQETGASVWGYAKSTATKADEFVKNNKKAQVGIGIAAGVAALTLAGLCIKGIINKVKEVKNK